MVSTPDVAARISFTTAANVSFISRIVSPLVLRFALFAELLILATVFIRCANFTALRARSRATVIVASISLFNFTDVMYSRRPSILTSSTFILGKFVFVASAYEMNALTASLAFWVACLLCTEFSYAVFIFELGSELCLGEDFLYFISRGASGLNRGFTDSAKLPK